MAKQSSFEVSIMSMIISTLTFGFLGYYIAIRVNESYFSSITLFYFIIGIFIMIGFSFGFRFPIAAEGFSMAIAFLILIQVSWDWLVQDFSARRINIMIGSAILFFLNLFTSNLHPSHSHSLHRNPARSLYLDSFFSVFS